VVASSKKIAQPKYVRYAWKPYPENANLINETGLPTSCFSSEFDE